VGARYKPDLVAVDARHGRPRFWGEAGHVGPEKIEALVDRYPDTHPAIAKWDRSLSPTRKTVESAVQTSDRPAPIDLLRFPADGDQRFLTENGRVSVSWDEVTWIRLGHADRIS